MRFKIWDSHLTWKVVNKCLDVRERVEVVDWNKKRSPHFPSFPLSCHCLGKKTLIKKNCELLLAVLIYMQEQQDCFHETWHIRIEIVSNGCSRISFKDAHREEAPSNKTPALSESMNMDIWVVGTSNQLFVTGSYTEKFFSKNVDTGKTAFFVIGQFCTPHSICLNIGSWELSFVWICYACNRSTFNYETILNFFKEKVFSENLFRSY